jgi:L-threonylcarbamoyladenylate synthase
VSAPRFLSAADAAGVLTTGGVLVLGTDTLPGLHCRADRPDAVARIFGLKGRPPERALLLLAASREQAGLATGTLNPFQERCCALCWPGPFSLILPADGALPSVVTAGGTTVAVRVPRFPDLQEIVNGAGFPLVSTSANLTGRSPIAEVEAASALFGNGIDGWWNQPGTGGGQPSALVDLTRRPVSLLREGPEPWPRDLDSDSPEI